MNRKQFFDMHAEKWDSYIPKGLIRKIKNKILPFFKIKKSDKILDVGCGTGILLPLLREKAGRNSIIIALDYSEKMLAIARKKFGSDFKYVKANAEKTPFKNDYFDKIICYSVFPHFVNKNKVLAELNRILNKKGMLIIAHADSREAINLRHSQIKGPVCKDFMPNNDVMSKILKRNGFNDIKIIEKKDCYILTAKKNRNNSNRKSKARGK